MIVHMAIRIDMSPHVLALVCLLATVGVWAQVKPTVSPAEKDSEFWRAKAAKTLEEALSHQRIEKAAKNVIFFIGDGMGLTTIVCSRILKGQLKGNTGEEERFCYEKFPNIGLSKTYSVDRQSTDSASTGTAYHTGVKANLATVGVNGHAEWSNCASTLPDSVKVKSSWDHAQASGKHTGLISTARITHASPAPLYSHCADRRWERDTMLTDEAKRNGCPDIAVQLLDHVGRNAQVVMGGGRREFTPPSVLDPESGSGGLRGDGRNLIQEWVDFKRNNLSQSVEYVWNKQQLSDLDVANTDNLIGLFEASHMKYDFNRDLNDPLGDPSIADMTEKAIQVLSKNPMGYYLFVEGAGIDLAHHSNLATLALHDCIAMEEAVQRALNMTDLQDTLIVVSSDHSVPLTMIGYSSRGNNILGLIDQNGYGSPPWIPQRNISNIDFKTFPTLVYGTGPGFNPARPEFPESEIVRGDFNKRPTAVPNEFGTHDGTDVGIFATGPMGHLIYSTHEQSYIFHAMKYAACLTDHAYAPHCRLADMGGSLARRLDWIKWNAFLQVAFRQFATHGVMDAIVRAMVK